MTDIRHPFICNMEHFFQTDERLYFVMPYFKGGDLYNIHKYYKKFSEKVAKFYATQIVIAIGELHERGIVHRDLKLKNIVLCWNGYLKLIDFGLACTLGHAKLENSILGTTQYMAPEILKTMNKEALGYDKGVDWWALGILIYEMVMGHNPFTGPGQGRKKFNQKLITQEIVWPNKV